MSESCDFCEGPRWARIFHCPHGLLTKGDWHACSVCAAMIDSENWTGLLLRALDRIEQRCSGIPRRVLADITKRSHDLFRANYVKEKHEQHGD